jgi:hypothetical protein
MQEEITCMQGVYLKVRTVTWNKKPMANPITQQIDRTDRREFPAEIWICRAGTFRKNKPNAVVPGRFVVIS